MKTRLRTLLAPALLAVALQPVFAQSPWAAPAGSGGPAFYSYISSNRMPYLSIPQPGALWGLYYSQGTAGPALQNVVNEAYRTLDGGQTWNQQEVARGLMSGTFQFPTTGQDASDMSAVDAQTAWVMKYDIASPANSLMRTTTGPAGFVQITTAIPRFTTIHFFSATVGIGVTASAAGAGTWPIYRTTDGGVTWSPVATAPATAGGASESVSSKQSIGNCLWLRTGAGTLLRTPDTGLSWTASTCPGNVAFENTLTGLAYKQTTAAGLELYRTSNGGITWTPVAFSGQPKFTTMTAIPGAPGTYLSAGYAGNASLGTVTSGVSAISRDGGASWQVLSSDNTPFSQLVAGSNGEVWVTVARTYPFPPSPLLRLNTAVLAAKNARGASPLAAYPNPTTGLLHVEGVVSGPETVRVYDVQGRLCQTALVSERVRAIDLARQAAGVYQLQLTAADGSVRNLRVSKTE
jgi:hypothetical protein